MRKVIKDASGLYRIKGLYTPQEIYRIADELLSEGLKKQGTIGAPSEVADLLSLRFKQLGHEEFHVVFLDARHRIIKIESMFRGGLTGAAVYPGEVVKAALLCNSAALIIAHNHPSGVSEPSAADRELTNRIYEACKLVEIRLLDHLVFGEDYVSFAARGWL